MASKSTKPNWQLWLRLGFSILLLGWFIFAFDWRQIFVYLKGVQPGWIGVALVWIGLAVGVSALKWQIILRAQGLEVKLIDLWRTYWVGFFFNNFLPSSIGGDAMRILWVGKATQDVAGATTSVVIERVLATVGLSLVGLLGCFVVPNSRPEIIGLFSALILLSVLLLVLIMAGRLPGFIVKRSNRVTQFLSRLIEHGQKVRQHPRAILHALFWSAIFQVCVVGTNYALLRSLHLKMVDVWTALYVIPATSVAAMLPLGINGYGVREGAYVMLFRPYGVPEAAAFTTSVLFAFLVSICSLWGGWVWLKKPKIKK